MSSDVLDALVSPYGASTVTLAIFSFLILIFRKSFVGLIEKEVKKDVEKYKHELETKKEIIRHELTEEAQKARYLSTSIQEIYPLIYKNLLQCEGGLCHYLGLRELPDWNLYSARQVEDLK
jgi:hypothetical protein